MNQGKPAASDKRSQAALLFFGGIVPLVGYALIEDNYGPMWGTIAGMALGIGEISFEFFRYRKVSKLTWGSNALILVLGAVTIFTNDGIWFKLQPAIIELLFSFLLWGSLLLKKNLFLAMAEKQGSQIPEIIRPRMDGLCFRLGLFMAIHAALATWAAFYWSTSAWVWLKGAGLTVSMLLYMIGEGFFIRRSLKKMASSSLAQQPISPPHQSPPFSSSSASSPNQSPIPPNVINIKSTKSPNQQ